MRKRTSPSPAPYRPILPWPKDGWPELDAGFRDVVRVLREEGIETTESCQGGQGHPFPEPTVKFSGGKHEGYRAVAAAMMHGLKVTELRRVWAINDGELVGPEWEMTFITRLGGGGKPVPKRDGSGKMTWKWI